VGTDKIWQENNATLVQVCTLNLDPSGNSLGPDFCAQPIGSLDFEGSLVLDSSVNPPTPRAPVKLTKNHTIVEMKWLGWPPNLVRFSWSTPVATPNKVDATMSYHAV
jgi:hypothetical protein